MHTATVNAKIIGEQLWTLQQLGVGPTIKHLHVAGAQLSQACRATLSTALVFGSSYRCPDCGGSDAYRSRRRTFLERYILPLLMLQPVRCANCFRRTTVSVFTSIGEP